MAPSQNTWEFKYLLLSQGFFPFFFADKTCMYGLMQDKYIYYNVIQLKNYSNTKKFNNIHTTIHAWNKQKRLDGKEIISF